jgi:lysophospholipase L1-like esterase
VEQGTPDVIVVELGGNDLSLTIADGGTRPPITTGSPTSAPDAGPSLVSGFLQFIEELRANFPAATFVLAWNAEQVGTAIDSVVQYYANGDAGGSPPVRVVGFNDKLPFPGAGCAGHPSAAQQAVAGQMLATFIMQTMNW